MLTYILISYYCKGGIELKLEDLKQIIFKDSYIDLAITEYLKFKETEDYGEGYKEKILKEVNSEVRNKKITSENVLDIVKYFQKNNPQSGSFVHWSNLDDLSKYAKERPVEVAELFNYLYEESVSLSNRIKKFYNKGKEYKSSLKLGTPLFGYLMAGFDREKYPLYKDEIFRDFLKTFTINESMGDVTDKYITYYEICNMLKDYFKQKGYITNPTMLDIQDFIYCISQYVQLSTKISVLYLSNHSKTLKKFAENDELLLDYIVNLDEEYLNRILNKYNKNEKVNLIRYKVCEKILKDRSITLEELEEIKAEVSNMYDTDILKPWSNFRILFPFYYEQYKEKVNVELYKLYKSIIDMSEFKNVKFKKDKYICDFQGPMNLGDDRCWLVVYPDNKSTHRKAAQLYIGIFPHKIEYGLGFGTELQVPMNMPDRLEVLQDPKKFDYNKMKEKLIEVFDEFKEINFTESKTEENEIDSITKKLEQDTVHTQIDEIAVEDDSYEMPYVSFGNELVVDKLYFEDKDTILKQISTALKAGKHIILIGPPGTGKSKLAKEVCRSYGVDYIMATATSDWSTYETIGGYKPDVNNRLYFDEGIFLKAIKDKKSKKPINRWLIIDEINRADIDKAFGALFSALTGDKVTLSFKAGSQNNIVIRMQMENEDRVKATDYEYIIPKDWRLIGTMNTYDKASLYEMSYAFMRRFAFIPVMVPKKIDEDLIKKYLNIWNIEDRSINEINLETGLAEIWRIINNYRVVGPAIIEDIARYVSERGDYTSAIILYVLPQFEGLTEETITKFINDLYNSNIGDFKQYKRILDNFVKDFFGIDINQGSQK